MLQKIKKWLLPIADDPELLAKFEKEESRERVPNYRIASGLASLFIAAGAVMDRFAFPDPTHWPLLVLLRAECSLTLLFIYALLGTEWGKKQHLLIGHFIEGSLVVSILAMIWLTGGGASPYYAGLGLVMVGASLLLRWSFTHGLVNVLLCCGGFTLVSTLWPIWPYWNHEQLGVLENYSRGVSTSTFFLYVTGFFTASGNLFLYRLRLSEFKLREELKQERALLEERNAMLKDLDESKTRFFANMSHELRTPLTLILGPIGDLAAYPPVRENASMSRMVTAMEENGLRLLRLINELLDLIKLDGGELQRREEICILSELVESVSTSFAPTMEKKGISFHCDLTEAPEGFYKLEQMKLEKILLNFLSNAAKFTPTGGRVELSLRKVEAEHFEIVVADSGKGMTEEEAGNVFKRFWQADTSARRKHRGAGIGLALAKGLIDSMGGTVTVKSQLGVGTTFRVVFPLFRTDTLDPIDPESEKSDDDQDLIEILYNRAQLEGNVLVDDVSSVNLPIIIEPSIDRKVPTLLIADDELGMRELLMNQLSQYRLLVASDGEQALQLAKDYHPDLILLDWMMPERDGLEVTRLLRGFPDFYRTPIILLTARIDERSKIEALEAGANDFLTKPFVQTELKLRIGQLLKARKYQNEIVEKSRELNLAMEELKESESMLVQAEKLSSLGQMSAGIIHEINNPLNYAKTNLYSLRTFARVLPEDEQQDFRDVITDVEEGLDRVVQIVKDLRGFAVKDKVRFSDVNLAEIVSTSARLVGHRLSKVRFESNVSEHLLLTGNANQLCQVLVNFLQNSLDALSSVEKENERGEITISSEENANTIALHIRDNGCGIADEIRERIFDPFFTSKEIGKGMGLGLSICYRILQQHGVEVGLESEVGKGTHFTLSFPRDFDLGENTSPNESVALNHQYTPHE